MNLVTLCIYSSFYCSGKTCYKIECVGLFAPLIQQSTYEVKC